ncbi:hypothetical protein ACVI1N_005217 [Sinorhizobium medicae]
MASAASTIDSSMRIIRFSRSTIAPALSNSVIAFSLMTRMPISERMRIEF